MAEDVSMVERYDLRTLAKFKDCEALLTTHIPQEETRNRFRVNLLLVDGLDEVSPRHIHE